MRRQTTVETSPSHQLTFHTTDCQIHKIKCVLFHFFYFRTIRDNIVFVLKQSRKTNKTKTKNKKQQQQTNKTKTNEQCVHPNNVNKILFSDKC